MAEPNITTVAVAVPIAVLFTTAFGAVYGIYALILAAAITGSFFALLAAPKLTRWQSAGLMLRSILVALLMTAGAAHFLSDVMGWAVDELYVFVSFGISALGDKWIEIIDTLKTAIQNMLGDLFKRGSK